MISLGALQKALIAIIPAFTYERSEINANAIALLAISI